MLEFQEVTIRQGGFALTVDWHVAPGELISVIGPSGAGKSTLLAGLAGFAEAVDGRITWSGSALPPRPDARPVSMLFQDNNLFPHLTVAQNVGLGIRPALRLTAEDTARVTDALTRVGLAGLEARKPAALSGGQQSRAALARVLVQARPIVLLDEPFSALGPAMRVEMLDIVKQVAADLGALVMMVTHDPDEARRLGGRSVLVADGVAQPPVPVGDLLANPPPALAAYLGRAQG